MSVPPHLAALFPNIVQADCRQTSPVDRFYNCIGFAADPSRLRKWWPAERWYWPRGVPREATLAAFEAAFATLGYSVCDSEALEPGFEKIALFVAPSGEPTHAARQCADGIWTSKLGQLEDIQHPLHQVEGTEYGRVARIMKRPRPAASSEPAAGGT